MKKACPTTAAGVREPWLTVQAVLLSAAVAALAAWVVLSDTARRMHPSADPCVLLNEEEARDTEGVSRELRVERAGGRDADVRISAWRVRPVKAGEASVPQD